MTGVKICGLTRAEDVRRAADLGAAYLGFNFSASSPRRLSPEAAAEVAGAAGDGVPRVGIFVREDADHVRRCVEAAGISVLQFHRPLAESDFRFGLPVVAVSAVGPGGPLWPEPGLLARCHAILFDTADAARAGGTGLAFDWGLIASGEPPVARWLAGGLSSENVARAIRVARPALVDVASGVESSPGVKSASRMAEVFAAVRGADRDDGNG